MTASLQAAACCAACGVALLLPRPETTRPALLFLAATALAVRHALSPRPSSSAAEVDEDEVTCNSSSSQLAEELSGLIAESLLKQLPSSSGGCSNEAQRKAEAERLETARQLRAAQAQAESWRVTASELALLLNQLGQSTPVSGTPDASSASLGGPHGGGNAASGGGGGGSGGGGGGTAPSSEGSTPAPASPTLMPREGKPHQTSPGQQRRRYSMPTNEINDHVAHEHAHRNGRRSTPKQPFRRSHSFDATAVEMEVTSAPGFALPPADGDGVAVAVAVASSSSSSPRAMALPPGARSLDSAEAAALALGNGHGANSHANGLGLGNGFCSYASSRQVGSSLGDLGPEGAHDGALATELLLAPAAAATRTEGGGTTGGTTGGTSAGASGGVAASPNRPRRRALTTDALVASSFGTDALAGARDHADDASFVAPPRGERREPSRIELPPPVSTPVTALSVPVAADAGPPALAKPVARKTALQLIKATAHEVELEVPPDMRVRAVHKAETLVRLSWLTPPSTFLLLKKPGYADITQALFEIGSHLCSRADMLATLIVEPAVFREMSEMCDSELTLHTWATPHDGFTPPPEAAIDLSSLSEMVDLVVCLGGDGTLLCARTLTLTLTLL